MFHGLHEMWLSTSSYYKSIFVATLITCLVMLITTSRTTPLTSASPDADTTPADAHGSITVTNSDGRSARGGDSGRGLKAAFYYVPPRHLVPPITASSTSMDAQTKEEFTEKCQPTFLELNNALRKYREMSEGVIRQLSISHEVALRTERLLFPHHQRKFNHEPTNLPLFLSCQIESKISKVSELLEQNSFVLEELLKPFPVSLGLSHFTNASSSVSQSASSTPPSTPDFELAETQTLARYIPPHKTHSAINENDALLEEHPYDEASQIIVHIARDWSSDGAQVRQQTHSWIIDELKYHHSYSNMDGSEIHSLLSPVLVPGAGAGRLAFDIALLEDLDGSKKRYPFAVEANDNSIVMAAATYHTLNNIISLSSGNEDNVKRSLYPFVADSFSNEVATERRWEPSPFPDDTVVSQLKQHSSTKSVFTNSPELVYSVGDFVTTYASPAKKGVYGSIVTCFFLDTATNIYEYIFTVRNLLRKPKSDSAEQREGGVWINFGPVQWHRNAQLQPSVNELKDLIQLAGFEIKYWEVEDELIAYRHPEDVHLASGKGSGKPRFTRSEAYRPLKFIAVPTMGDASISSTSLMSSLEQVRSSTGRRPLN